MKKIEYDAQQWYCDELGLEWLFDCKLSHFFLVIWLKVNEKRKNVHFNSALFLICTPNQFLFRMNAKLAQKEDLLDSFVNKAMGQNINLVGISYFW
jgi:hypothetical protein